MLWAVTGESLDAFVDDDGVQPRSISFLIAVNRTNITLTFLQLKLKLFPQQIRIYHLSSVCPLKVEVFLVCGKQRRWRLLSCRMLLLVLVVDDGEDLEVSFHAGNVSQVRYEAF